MQTMQFEELESTRTRMLSEFETEQNATPYMPKLLTAVGYDNFVDAVRNAILSGSEVTLFAAIRNPDYWVTTQTVIVKGRPQVRTVNVDQAAERLALTEFNTLYVRGLSGRLIDEGVELCTVTRAGLPKWEPSECSVHEGAIVSVRDVYAGHRARYWPEPGNHEALSVPFGPGCHHTIKR